MNANVADDPISERHRALSDKSRLALLRILEAAESPLDAHTLAERVGLHVNTARWHLSILAGAGLVREERAPPGGRGRPKHTYGIVLGGLDDSPGGFKLLAEVLVDSLAEGGETRVEEAGRVRGRALVQPPADGRASAKQALAQVVKLLEDFGFQPRVERERGGQRVAMRPCPFGQLAVDHAEIVCPVHLGLMRGALEALEAPVEADLEPFVRPNLCLAHLRTRAAPRPR